MFYSSLKKRSPTGSVAVKGTNRVVKDSITEDNGLEILLKILEVSKCKLCGLVVSYPAILCSAGHALCKGCQEQTMACPTCTKPFTTADLSALSLALMILPRECKNMGCPVIIKPGDDHQVRCGFQQTSCRLCRWIGPGCNILAHVEIDHPEIKVFGKENEAKWEHFEIDQARNDVTPIFIQGNFLWGITKYCVDLTAREFVKDYIFVPNGKTLDKIRVRITFGDRGSGSINVSEKQVYHNHNDLVIVNNTFVIPIDLLRIFTDSNQVLRWKEEFIIDNCSSGNIEQSEKISTLTQQTINHLSQSKRKEFILPDVVVKANSTLQEVLTTQPTNAKTPPIPPPKPEGYRMTKTRISFKSTLTTAHSSSATVNPTPDSLTKQEDTYFCQKNSKTNLTTKKSDCWNITGVV